MKHGLLENSVSTMARYAYNPTTGGAHKLTGQIFKLALIMKIWAAIKSYSTDN